MKNQSSKIYAVIDAGGTNIRVTCVEEGNNISPENVESFPNCNNFAGDLEKIEKVIDKKLAGAKLDAIAIAFAGTVENDKRVKISQNLSSWNEKDFREKLQKKYGPCPVYLRNDASMAALAEAMFGGVDSKDFVYVTWGTGIGGCKIKFERGKPEVIDLDWWQYFEKWEHDCGGRFVSERLGKSMAELNAREWNHIMDIFVEDMKSVSCKLDCNYFVLGGGVVDKQRDRIIEFFKKVDLPVKVHVSNLGDNSGLYGGLALLKQSLEV